MWAHFKTPQGKARRAHGKAVGAHRAVGGGTLHSPPPAMSIAGTRTKGNSGPGIERGGLFHPPSSSVIARLIRVLPGSVLREMTTLATVFEAARREWRWIDSNPVRDVRRPAQPKHREKTLTPIEILAMLRALKWRSTGKPATTTQAIGRAFVFALQTGMRAGEICGLEWADLQAHSVKIRDGKTGARTVPITPTARRTIESMRGRDDIRIFGMDSQSLDVLFRRARSKAGLSGFVFHDTRHTAATRMAQKLHVLELCNVFGWTSTTRALPLLQH